MYILFDGRKFDVYAHTCIEMWSQFIMQRMQRMDNQCLNNAYFLLQVS